MDDDEDIQQARGVAADPDDVLFSGNRATQPEYDEYDPLLNGHSSLNCRRRCGRKLPSPRRGQRPPIP